MEWFTDRPVRDARGLDAEQPADIWTNQFDTSPPNAAITGDNASAVVVLTGLSSPGSAISFGFEVIRGKLADGYIGTVSIFLPASYVANCTLC